MLESSNDLELLQYKISRFFSIRLLYCACCSHKSLWSIGGRKGASRGLNIKHQPEPVWFVTEICACQHVYYHLSLSDSDRPMLLVHMLPKLILFFSGSWWPQTCIPDRVECQPEEAYMIIMYDQLALASTHSRISREINRELVVAGRTRGVHPCHPRPSCHPTAAAKQKSHKNISEKIHFVFSYSTLFWIGGYRDISLG